MSSRERAERRDSRVSRDHAPSGRAVINAARTFRVRASHAADTFAEYKGAG